MHAAMRKYVNRVCIFCKFILLASPLLVESFNYRKEPVAENKTSSTFKGVLNDYFKTVAKSHIRNGNSSTSELETNYTTNITEPDSSTTSFTVVSSTRLEIIPNTTIEPPPESSSFYPEESIDTTTLTTSYNSTTATDSGTTATNSGPSISTGSTFIFSTTVSGPETTTAEVSTSTSYSSTFFPSTTTQVGEIPDNNTFKCPKDFHYYNHYCIFITHPQPFPPKCPYPNFNSQISFGFLSNLNVLPAVDKIWYYGKKFLREGMDEFLSLDRGENYKKISKIPVNSGSAECATISIVNYNFSLTDCGNKHQFFCWYNYDHFYNNKPYYSFCARNQNNPHCFFGDFGYESCFCNVNKGFVGVNEFCEKLAEPLEPYQTTAMAENAPFGKDCWFGVENCNGTFKWTFSEVEIGYSFWSPYTNFELPFGFLNQSQSRWQLADDRSLECAFCEFYPSHEVLTIELKYDPRSRMIRVLVVNDFELTTPRDVYCFSDYGSKAISERVPVRFEDLGNYTVWIEEYPSFFWCEAFQLPGFTNVLSNTILAFDSSSSFRQEYALGIFSSSASMISTYNFTNYYLNGLIENNTQVCILSLRPIKFLDYNEDGSFEFLVHLSTCSEVTPQQEDDLQNLLLNDQVLNVTFFANSVFCLESKTEEEVGTVLTWPKTPVGAIAIPKELCVRNDFSPVTRRCGGDFFFGGKWEAVNGSCSTTGTIPESLEQLYQLLNNDQSSPQEVAKNLSEITGQERKPTVSHVLFTSKILENLSELDVNLITVLEIINNVMAYNRTTLKESQLTLNSTDSILYSFDKILQKISLDSSGFFFYTSPYVLVQIVDPYVSDVSGLALYNTPSDAHQNFSSYRIVQIFRNFSVSSLDLNDLQAATFFSEKTLDQIQRTPPYSSNLYFSAFYFDALFNENPEEKRYAQNNIFSVFVENFYDFFVEPLPLIFRSSAGKENSTGCGFWNYGSVQNLMNIYGSWNSSNVTILWEEGFDVCAFRHTTHFGLLVLGEDSDYKIVVENELVLVILSAIGSAMSLFGVLCIFVTAAFMKGWRSETTNKILLNFSASIALEIILVYLNGLVKNDGVWCIISGTSLHYIVISKFCWMLTIALLQYLRFVRVFHTTMNNLLWKCVFFAWGVPFLPIIIVVSFSVDNYELNFLEICYLNEPSFIYGLVIPVSTILVLNLAIFIRIFFNICFRRTKTAHGDNRQYYLHARLAVLLFFLLGLNWILGLLANLFGELVFTILFCVTETLQGFMIFVFYVLGNTQTRRLWSSKGKFWLQKKTISHTQGTQKSQPTQSISFVQ